MAQYAATTKGAPAGQATRSAAVTKAVIPAAGLGTRFLPATKATPKEMLPVVDKPAIQYVVEEAVAAGLGDVLLITGRSKRAIEDHFDRAHELEHALTAKDDTDRLATVREPSELANMHYVRQGDPKGLGHAVLCAAHHVGNEPFAVLLGDDLIDQRDSLLTRMIEVRNRYGGSVVALMEVEPEQVSQYGCAAIAPTAEEDVVLITDLIEKPALSEAPSRWIVIGRYICDPAVFGVLRRTPPGRGGEIQLTDALRELARAAEPSAGPFARRDTHAAGQTAFGPPLAGAAAAHHAAAADGRPPAHPAGIQAAHHPASAAGWPTAQAPGNPAADSASGPAGRRGVRAASHPAAPHTAEADARQAPYLSAQATAAGHPPPGGGVHGVLFRGRRYDTGNKLDYLRTLVQIACERPDLAGEFVPWLRKYLADLP